MAPAESDSTLATVEHSAGKRKASDNDASTECGPEKRRRKIVSLNKQCVSAWLPTAVPGQVCHSTSNLVCRRTSSLPHVLPGHSSRDTSRGPKKRIASPCSGNSTPITSTPACLSRTLPPSASEDSSRTDSLSSLPTSPYSPQLLPSVHLLVETSSCIALDCEFVGVVGGASALGRCSIVDFDGEVLLDIYARPELPIADYRTPWSGLKPCHMINAIPFESAQRKIKQFLEGKVLIGHALHNDLRVLELHHPKHMIRDTSTCPLINAMAELPLSQPVSLKRLSKILLGRSIQRGSHCSVEDARATLALYKLARPKWETILLGRNHRVSLHTTSEKDKKSFLDDEFWPHDVLHQHPATA